MAIAYDPVVPELQHVFEVEVELHPLDDYGVTGRGHRRVVPIAGGRIYGDIDAEILPGGADWQIVRPNGTIEIDCRYSARTEQGELLYLQVTGVRSGPAEVLRALGAGEDVSPEQYYFRTTLTVETSSIRLKHLENSLFVASCVREANVVRYAAYRIS